MNRYYSTAKDYTVIKRRHLLFRAALKLYLRFLPQTDFVFEEALPENEPVVILSNHAREYAPLAFLKGYRRDYRLWSIYNLCFARKIPNHVMYCFFPNAKGAKAKLLRLLSYLIAPFIPPVFRALEVIPSYQNYRAETTFEKSLETLDEGKDVIIFPETEVANPDYRYVNNLNGGFIRVAAKYYAETGKTLAFYPAYSCKALRTVVVGHPVTIDPAAPYRPQVAAFKKQIMDEIERLGNTLPEHKIVPFSEPIDDPARIEKYADPERYGYRDTKRKNKENNHESKNKIRSEPHGVHAYRQSAHGALRLPVRQKE